MPKSPREKRSVVMVRMKNIYVRSVLADGVGKCVCYHICAGGVSSYLLVNVWLVHRHLSITGVHRDEEFRKRLGIESLLDENLDRMRMHWMEKVANMSATLDDNRLLRKLLGAWCFGGKR